MVPAVSLPVEIRKFWIGLVTISKQNGVSLVCVQGRAQFQSTAGLVRESRLKLVQGCVKYTSYYGNLSTPRSFKVGAARCRRGVRKVSDFTTA